MSFALLYIVVLCCINLQIRTNTICNASNRQVHMVVARILWIKYFNKIVLNNAVMKFQSIILTRCVCLFSLISIIPVRHLSTFLSQSLYLHILTPIMLIKYEVLELASGIWVHYSYSHWASTVHTRPQSSTARLTPYHSSYLNKFRPRRVLTAAHRSGFINMTLFPLFYCSCSLFWCQLNLLF